MAKTKSKLPTIKFKECTSKDGKLTLKLPVRPRDLSEAKSRPYWLATKAVAIDLETTNTHCLVLYHRFGKWWQMGGTSLLIYLHHLQKLYNLREIKANIDRDFAPRWDNNPGCAAIADIVSFSTELQNKAKATIYLDSEELIIFNIRKIYSKDVLETYRNIKIEREKRVNKVLMPQVMDPALKNACMELNRLIVTKVANLAPAKRETLIKDGIESSNWIAYNFIRMARGRTTAKSFYYHAANHLEIIQDWLVYARTYSVFNLEDEEKILAAWMTVSDILEKYREQE